jgi:hypothetical protein
MKKVNAHLHTPYSFSAFTDVNQALDMAVTEGVGVVGINDFYSTAGYEAWANGCKQRGLYPLFNIEFISLNEADQKAGLRVNDPGNPGRTYLSGKGLSYPFQLAEPFATQLADVSNEANAQVEAMCNKVNLLLVGCQAGFTLDFEWIISDLTKGSIRERHLAKALRLKVYEACNNNPLDIRILFHKLFGGKELKSEINDIAGVENEIRGNLLKAGGGAFVPEDPKAFLPMQTVCDIIVADSEVPETGDGKKDWQAIQKHKLQVDTRKWLLSKLAPKKYGDKLEVSGDAANPLVTRIERVVVKS